MLKETYRRDVNGSWINLQNMNEIRLRHNEETDEWEIIAITGTIGWVLHKDKKRKNLEPLMDKLFD